MIGNAKRLEHCAFQVQTTGFEFPADRQFSELRIDDAHMPGASLGRDLKLNAKWLAHSDFQSEPTGFEFQQLRQFMPL